MTIKDIARISGCSVSTISRVINDRPDVRPETKEHVLEIMRQVGFVPNSNARQLKIQQSRSVVFVVKGTQNMFFADFLVQLQQVVGLYGYSGIVSYLDEDANEMEAAGRILREIKPKGMIFLGGSVENFRRSFDQITVPAVLATVVTDELDFPNLSMVGVDDRAAAYQAVTCLIAQGHRQICVVGGPATSYPSRMRRLGAQQAMEDNGLVFDPRLYGLSSYSFEPAGPAGAVHRRLCHERRHRHRGHPGPGLGRVQGAGGRVGDRLRRHRHEPLLRAGFGVDGAAHRRDGPAGRRAAHPADRARRAGPDHRPLPHLAGGGKHPPAPRRRGVNPFASHPP